MTLAWAAIAALVAAATDAAPAPESLLAINPNISVGTCSGGGDAIDVSPSMGTRTFAGRFYGELHGETVFGQYCTGHYETEPSYCVSVAGPGSYYTFEITDAEGVDTTLAITGGSLEWPFCDDDGAGHDLLSKAVIWLEPGEYFVHVGSFSQGGSARYTMTVRSGEHW